MTLSAPIAGAKSDAEIAAPLLGSATAMVVQIRQRTTIDPSTADATALDAQTSWWPVSGTATFRTTPTGVDLVFPLNNCRKPYGYPIVLYAGSDCSAIEADSQPWDGPRGVLSSKTYCFGAPARLYESPFTDLTPRGPEGLFSPGAIDELIATLDEIRQAALAA